MFRRIKFALKIWKAIKRGEKLHPGSYTLHEWEYDLCEEINEWYREERGSGNWTKEAVDVLVVAYRMLEAIELGMIKYDSID